MAALTGEDPAMTAPEPHISVAGRRWPVACPWGAIDPYGYDVIERWITAAVAGGPGSEVAVARLCELTTGGALKAAEVLAVAPPRDDTVRGLYAAWQKACYGGPDSRPWPIRKLFPRRHVAAVRARLRLDLARAQMAHFAPCLSYLETLASASGQLSPGVERSVAIRGI